MSKVIPFVFRKIPKNDINEKPWQVGFSSKAERQFWKLSEEIRTHVQALVQDLKTTGPYQPNWRNFGKLVNQGDRYHCHVKHGRPTYVVCWEVMNKKIRIMEVYYVGTHENAPY